MSRRGKSMKVRSPSLVDKAKSMMNSLPFSSSTDAEAGGVDASGDERSVRTRTDERERRKEMTRRMMGKKKKDKEGKDGKKRKKQNLKRSRTRDVGAIAKKLNLEEIDNKVKKKKEKRKNGRHAGQRSRSVEFNVEDLTRLGSEGMISIKFHVFVHIFLVFVMFCDLR